MNTNEEAFGLKIEEDALFLKLKTVECVIDRESNFKAKLNIGEDAYALIMDGKVVKRFWGIGGAAASVGGAAMFRIISSHGSMAAKFFSTKWAALGAVSATTIGWIVASAILSGGIYYGVMYLYEKYHDTGVDGDPEFIKSPIDLLAADIFDMLASLALKIAVSSGGVDESERQSIISHFVEEWGFSVDYAENALPLIERNLDKSTIKKRISAMMRFQLENPNCNPQEMKQEFLEFLSKVAYADGQLDDQEKAAMKEIEDRMGLHLSLPRRFGRNVKKLARGAWGKIKPSKAASPATEKDQDPST